MPFLHDHTIDDAFHSALLALKRALIDGGVTEEVEQIAQWAHVKPNTVYKWLAQASTPRDFRTVWRLMRGSTAAGYAAFGQALVGGSMRLHEVRSVSTDGRLSNELASNTQIWGKLLTCEESGNADAIVALAAELKQNAAQVEAEGMRMRAEQGAPPSVLIISTGDGFGQA